MKKTSASQTLGKDKNKPRVICCIDKYIFLNTITKRKPFHKLRVQCASDFVSEVRKGLDIVTVCAVRGEEIGMMCQLYLASKRFIVLLSTMVFVSSFPQIMSLQLTHHCIMIAQIMYKEPKQSQLFLVLYR